MSKVPNLEPFVVWSQPDGKLTTRAAGFLRALLDFLGARDGTIPLDSLGADGVTATRFLSESGFRVPDYPTAANPSASVGTTAVIGTATTFMRSDDAPAIDQGITPTWTGAHIFNAGVQSTTIVTSGDATIGEKFGCNGKTAQASASANAAITDTAGATYGATEQAMLNDLKALTNQIRAALVANGVMV